MTRRASNLIRRLTALGAVCLALGVSARAATLDLFRNDTTLLNPGIDATAVLNTGQLTISSFGTLPFQTVNTLNFTNAASGTFSADVGFKFETVTYSNLRMPGSMFVNEGTINVGGVFLQGQQTFFQASGGSLVVYATNIVHPGTATAGAGGLLRFQGSNLDMSRATLVVQGLADPGTSFVTNYFNPTGVKDIYWGAGTSQVMSGRPSPLDLAQAEFAFRPPSASSPTHAVTGPNFFTGSSVSLPYSGASFAAFCWTNRRSATNLVFQVVLVGTNSSNTNILSQVRFNRRGGRATPIVELSLGDTDVLTGLSVSNFLYFSDSSIFVTNATLAGNLSDPTFRPEAYDLSGTAPQGWFLSEPTNQDIANITYLPVGASNSVVSNYYVAYCAEVGSPSFSFAQTITGGGNTALNDPTNMPGRVELIGDTLDLRLARVRAENTLIIKTSNLVSQAGAIFDAPVINYELANLTSTINLTNFLPSAVRRMNGQIFAYSCTWTNSVGPFNLEYHVLMLDAGQLTGVQPVSLPTINIRGTNVIVENILNAGKSFVIDSPALTFNATNQLFLTSVNIPSIVASNFPSLVYFTNLGTISVASEGRFGSDRPQPLGVMINRGFISGNTHSVRATNFENSGTIFAQAGPLTIDSTAAKLEAVTNFGSLFANGNLTLSGANFKIRNHTLQTASTLILAVTNLLTDNGAGASNQIVTGLGFSMQTKPATGDLIGTAIASTAPANRVVSHTWAGENRGARRNGFTNNAAIGRLTLGVNNNSILSFRGVGTNSNALYVDFLELTGPLQTNLSALVTINTNFVLYFANANVPVETLDGQLGGRLRWVRNFAGPSSGVDVILPNGRTFRVNNALLNSTTLDSDGDGIVNAFDLFPFDGVVMKSNVTFTNVPPLTAQITWEAAAQTDYQVEYTTSIAPPVWLPLMTYTNSVATNGPVTVRDPLPASGEQRFYRVRYDP